MPSLGSVRVADAARVENGALLAADVTAVESRLTRLRVAAAADRLNREARLGGPWRPEEGGVGGGTASARLARGRSETHDAAPGAEREEPVEVAA